MLPPVVKMRTDFASSRLPSRSPVKSRAVQAQVARPQLWRGYCRNLAERPVLTKSLTSLCGFMLGDILAQNLEGAASLELMRVARLGAYGLLLDGPAGHQWYKWLEAQVDKRVDNPRGAAAIAIKTAADQIVWAPIMTCVFFAFLKTLEGHPELAIATAQEKVVATVVANYLIWPAAHVISFKYVPSEQRILYNNFIAIGWNCYLSLVAQDTSLLNGADVSSGLQQIADVFTQDALRDALGSDSYSTAARALTSFSQLVDASGAPIDATSAQLQQFGDSVTDLVPADVQASLADSVSRASSAAAEGSQILGQAAEKLPAPIPARAIP